VIKKQRMQWQSLVLASGMLCTGAAFAQFVWIDEKGTRQYSDMPPPPSVPASRILKAPPAALPRKAPDTVAAPAETPAAPTSASTAAPPTTIAEKNADYNRRKAEREEQEKTATEQARLVADKAKNCERAHEYRRVLDSGQRIVTSDGGERAFMSDERRLQESRETRRVLDGCK
jgi:type IV secretory pathway VirB10-like protein